MGLHVLLTLQESVFRANVARQAVTVNSAPARSLTSVESVEETVSAARRFLASSQNPCKFL